MEPLIKLDKNSILGEEIFVEIFDQEDEIAKARMILSLTDRASELGVKGKFEELLKAYKKVDRENKRKECDAGNGIRKTSPARWSNGLILMDLMTICSAVRG